MHSECWLGQSLTEILCNNRYTDCKFIVVTPSGNKVYPGHKLIFSCASEVFERMLYGSYRESINGEVTLTDVEPKVFEKFREHIYSGTKQLNCYDLDTIFKLFEFGNKYLVKSFKEPCERQLLFLKDTCNAEQLLRIFQCAHTFNCPRLMEQVSQNLKLAARNNTAICYTGICGLSINAFKNYLNVVQGIFSEAMRFKLIDAYIRELCTATVADTSAESEHTGVSNKKHADSELVSGQDLVKELMEMIKFKKFTLQEFYDGPGKSKLLSIYEKYDKLCMIASTNAKRLKFSR